MTISIRAIDAEGRDDDLVFVANAERHKIYADGRPVFVGVDRDGVTKVFIDIPERGRIEIEAC